MRYLIIAFLILFTSLLVIADEVTANLDRMVSLAPVYENLENESSRLAIHFDIPEIISESDIIYAELIFDLDLRRVNYRGNTTLDLQAYRINSGWIEENANWENLADDIDSSGFYSFTYNLATDTTISMDITSYFLDILELNAENYGLMLVPHKLEQRAFHLEDQVIDLIRNNARIRIVYYR